MFMGMLLGTILITRGQITLPTLAPRVLTAPSITTFLAGVRIRHLWIPAPVLGARVGTLRISYTKDSCRALDFMGAATPGLE